MATPILFFASLASLTVTASPLLFLFWLMQPATRANPGVSAHIPPAGARVGPIAHMVESRDPPIEFSSATNFARDYTRPELVEDAQLHEAKVSVRPANRKQSRVGYRRKHEQSAHAYAQQWDNHWPSGNR